MSRRAALLLAPLALSGCAATHAITKQAAGALVSPEEEVALGREVKAELEGQTRRLEDPAVQAYVAELGRRVAEPSRRERAVPVEFVVLDAPDQVNAFAIPGGTIYVTSGLLLASRDGAEIAGVLAHEVGHVTERHVAQRLVAQYGLQALAAAALGGSPSVPAQIAASIASTGLLLKYSRDQEREADRAAVRALAATGISADGLRDFFLRLAEGRDQPAFLTFLQTHPAPEERAREVARLAAAMGARRGWRGDGRHALVRQRLRSYQAGRGRPVS